MDTQCIIPYKSAFDAIMHGMIADDDSTMEVWHAGELQMVSLGSGAEREVDDILLTRYERIPKKLNGVLQRRRSNLAHHTFA